MERRIPRPKEILEFGIRNKWKIGVGAVGGGGLVKVMTDPTPGLVIAAILVPVAAYQAYKIWNDERSQENNDARDKGPKS